MKTQAEITELQKKSWKEVYCIEEYTMTKEQSDAMYMEVYQPIVDWENEIAKNNRQIWKQVKSEKGVAFCRNAQKWFKELRDGCESQAQMKLEFLDKQVGKQQHVPGCYGREIKFEYSWQQSEGMEGDSWSGEVCIKISENKYLKTNFSM